MEGDVRGQSDHQWGLAKVDRSRGEDWYFGEEDIDYEFFVAGHAQYFQNYKERDDLA